MSANLVTLSAAEEGQLINKMINDIADFPEAGTKWYVISMSWWAKWKQYTTVEFADQPGPVNSEDILIPQTEYVQDPNPNYTNLVLNPG